MECQNYQRSIAIELIGLAVVTSLMSGEMEEKFGMIYKFLVQLDKWHHEPRRERGILNT